MESEKVVPSRQFKNIIPTDKRRVVTYRGDTAWSFSTLFTEYSPATHSQWAEVNLPGVGLTLLDIPLALSLQGTQAQMAITGSRNVGPESIELYVSAAGNELIKAGQVDTLKPNLNQGGGYPNLCSTCGKQVSHEVDGRCGACKSVWYCCKEHQRQDWPNHKEACSRIVDYKKLKEKETAPPTESAIPGEQDNLQKMYENMLAQAGRDKRGRQDIKNSSTAANNGGMTDEDDADHPLFADMRPELVHTPEKLSSMFVQQTGRSMNDPPRVGKLTERTVISGTVNSPSSAAATEMQL